MKSGEKELRKVFEETTKNNVTATVAHSNKTRVLMRKLEKKVEDLDNLIRQYDKRFEEMTMQLASIQSKVYAGGS